MKVVGAMQKNTTIMKAMGQMIKLPQISAVAQELQQEMLKVTGSEEELWSLSKCHILMLQGLLRVCAPPSLPLLFMY